MEMNSIQNNVTKQIPLCPSSLAREKAPLEAFSLLDPAHDAVVFGIAGLPHNFSASWHQKRVPEKNQPLDLMGYHDTGKTEVYEVPS